MKIIFFLFIYGFIFPINLFANSAFSPTEAKKIIALRANETIHCLKKKDFKTFSKLVHPLKGVRFTPYVGVNLKVDIVLSAKQLENISENKTDYFWGSEAASANPITCTFNDYFKKFVYDRNFAKAPKVIFNGDIQRGPYKNNINEIYPDGITVEYYFPGIDPGYEGEIWPALTIVFEKADDSKWYVVGIVHG
jgi:hypothetical protein